MSFFGAAASFFIMLMMLSVFILAFSVLHFIRRKGLLKFMPRGLQKLFLEVSIFEILVEVLIHRRMSKLIIAVVKPVAKSKTPQEARDALKDEGQIS